MDESSAQDPQVLIVGAGPTGLLLAGELERRDVRCLLIDSLDAPQQWDRATVVHPRSMEIFESLGLAGEFLERGLKTGGARIHSAGELLGVLDISLAHHRYPFDLGISEEVTESILTGHLERLGGQVTRSTSLVDLRPDGEGIVATIERTGERQEIAVPWLVGCDGLHSVVREHTGIEFEGSDIDAPWAVFDATIEGWDDDFDMAASYMDVPAMILTPLPGRRWRAYLRPTSDSGDLVEDATDLLRTYKPGASFTDIENPTRFHCHARVATRFRAGQVLLAGDAAHACSPAEGHGMNTGLQDAFNLGWKLAMVCRGEAGPALLDSYEAERRPVAQLIVESGVAAEAAQLTTGTEEVTARNAMFRQTFADADSAHHEAVAAAELNRSYAASPVVSGDLAEQLGAGTRVPETSDVEPLDAAPCCLHELAHRPGHTLFALGGPAASPADVAGLVSALEEAARGSAVFDAVVGLCTNPGTEPVGRLDEAVASQLGVKGITVLAIRPDRYVGLRDDAADPAAVDRYLAALAA
jgi:2-polyprenyl-6-methoxyphenol hydroxylase-like FAD-dependent oxidoreductase